MYTYYIFTFPIRHLSYLNALLSDSLSLSEKKTNKSMQTQCIYISYDLLFLTKDIDIAPCGSRVSIKRIDPQQR